MSNSLLARVIPKDSRLREYAFSVLALLDDMVFTAKVVLPE
jgi:hypothetical protein